MDKYKIPKVNLSVKDGCKNKNNVLSLKSYQIIPFIHFKNNNSLLLYHSVGSGKTATAINIMKYYNKSYNIILFIKAALRDGWIKELNLWNYPYNKQKKSFDNLYIYHYDSINGFNDFINDKKPLNNNFYIIDEAHNFINNVYSNNRQNKIHGVSRMIYEYIYNEKIKNKNQIKILLISATPLVNEPYELSILFNLLKPKCLPFNKSEFNNMFIEENKKKLYIINRNEFYKQTKNLISYYYGAIPNQYAISKIKFINVMMSKYQEEIYLYYHLKELQNPAEWDFYKIFSRQTSNFVFPYINNKINGYTRPRPSTYGGETPEFIDNINNHLNSFEKYLDDLYKDDLKSNKSIFNDIKEYNYNFNLIDKNINKCCKLLKALYNSSTKFLHIILKIIKSKGPVIVYTNFTMVEGISALSIYLKYFGFVKYSDNTKYIKKYNNKRFVEFHGMIKKELRDFYKNEFNKPENIYGELIKIFFVSSAGAEGITLYNVRQIHIVEPHWNEVRIQQVNGRGIRLCSHKNLPVDERNVKIYRYISIDNYDINHKILSTDQYLLHKSKQKEYINNQFLLLLKENSIDCELNKEHTKFDKNNKNMICYKK